MNSFNNFRYIIKNFSLFLGLLFISVSSLPELAAKTKKEKQELFSSKNNANYNSNADSIELGLRLGYFHPFIFMNLGLNSRQAQRNSILGYSGDIYYTQPLSLFFSKLKSPFIPDLHAFLSFHQYFLKANPESNPVHSMGGGLNIGFLYSFPVHGIQNIKLGMTAGGYYEHYSSINRGGFIFCFPFIIRL